MREMTLALDKNIAELRSAVQARVPGGLKNVVFVITGDHGVSPTTEYLADTGFASGRIQDAVIVKQLNDYMNKKYGTPKARAWIDDTSDFNFYLDEDNLHSAKLDIRRVESELKAQLLQNPAFAFVFTEAEWEDHVLPPGMFERKIQKTYFHGRSGQIIAIQRPYYVTGSKSAANHMTGYSYDRTVPIVFSGFGIKNGLYSTHTEVVDIAPTLAFLVGVLPPSMSEGRVLSEALK
jgi:predicted AlkP superfamily pyrophosphatase or phosphodiesterase